MFIQRCKITKKCVYFDILIIKNKLITSFYRTFATRKEQMLKHLPTRFVSFENIQVYI